MFSGITSNINNIPQVSFSQKMPLPQALINDEQEPSSSFDEEDKAIISSQAKLLNELDKFNSGGDNLVNLAEANVMAKITTEAEVNVINTQKDMLDSVLSMGI